MGTKWTFLAAGIMAALLAGSCSTGSTPASTGSDAGRSVELDGLALLDGSMLDESASRSISVEWSEDGSSARILADHVAGLKALYFSLEHPESFSAASLSAGDWATGNSLSLAITPRPGHSEAGIVLVNPQETDGFSGSGVLATLEFGVGNETRATSAPPMTEASRTTLYFSPEFFLFYWYYRNQGDYDQNGEVNISDLTPLAVHFGKSSGGGGFDDTSVESVVDGDGNGEINISDISPIGANFGNGTESFDLYVGGITDYPANPGDPLGGVQVLNIPLSEASGEAATQRLFFTEQQQFMIPPTSGAWLHPISGGSAGIASTAVGFGNQSPVADLQISSQTGVVPFNLSADASNSTDPDGDPLSFTWVFGDEISLFTSDALYNPADEGPQFSMDVGSDGEYKLFLLVRDTQGAIDFVLQDVVAADAAGWQIRDLDPTEQHSSLVELQDVDICEVGGMPCIGYSFKQGQSGSHIYFRQGESLFGDNWTISDLVHAQSGVDFTQVAVAEIGGTAAIAATLDQGGAGEAVFARQVESGEPGLFNTIKFEDANASLAGVDMANVNGQAMVAYRNVASGELRFCVALDNSAQNFLGPLNVAITGAPSSQICLKEVNGAPAFCYWAGPNSNRLRYHSATMNGVLPVFSSGTTLSVLTSCYLSDALVVREDGSPSVIFGIPAETAIYGFHAADPQVSMWTSDGEVSEPNSAIAEYCAGLHAGRPAILWYDVLDAALYYQRATDAEGTTWGPPELVDDSLAIGTRPCMAEVNGVPVIAYIDKGQNLISYGVYVE